MISYTYALYVVVSKQLPINVTLSAKISHLYTFQYFKEYQF